MSSARAMRGIALPDDVHRPPHLTSKPSASPFLRAPISRRIALLICTAPINSAAFSPASHARERRVRKAIPIEDYNATSEGLKYYDFVEGKGPIAERGALVKVHFDCVYRGITAVSSRESKLLAGNRIIAQETCRKIQSGHIKMAGLNFLIFVQYYYQKSFLQVPRNMTLGKHMGLHLF